MRAHSTMSPDEYFWPRVDQSGDCWLWLGATDKDGYGFLSYASKKVRAHCHAYALAHGPIPPGLCVLHTCDTPACVNPDHLFLGTNLDNIRDRTMKGRTAAGDRNGAHFRTRPAGQSGEVHHSARLTEADVREIRFLRSANLLSINELAERFGVRPGTIYAVVERKNWKHVT